VAGAFYLEAPQLAAGRFIQATRTPAGDELPVLMDQARERHLEQQRSITAVGSLTS